MSDKTDIEVTHNNHSKEKNLDWSQLEIQKNATTKRMYVQQNNQLRKKKCYYQY
jgi:cell division protein FtsL